MQRPRVRTSHRPSNDAPLLMLNFAQKAPPSPFYNLTRRDTLGRWAGRRDRGHGFQWGI